MDVPQPVAEAEAVLMKLVECHVQGELTDRAYLEARYDAGLAWLWAPAERGGRGITGFDQRSLEWRAFEAGCPDPRHLNPLGMAATGPAIIEHGSAAQAERWLRPLFTCEDTWCQLFSEPGAGSDLSGVSTRAERVGEAWQVTGLKIWTTRASDARWGLCLAQAFDGSDRLGLTCFVIPMEAPGVLVKPLRQMTGAWGSATVMLDAVSVPDENRVGGVGAALAVLLTITEHERRTLAGRDDIDTRELLADWRKTDPEFRSAALRQEVARLWALGFIHRLPRAAAWVPRSPSIRGSEDALLRRVRNTVISQECASARVALLGAQGMLLGSGSYDDAQGSIAREGLEPVAGLLSAVGEGLAGGTTELMKNMIAERVLGLPSERRAGAPRK